MKIHPIKALSDNYIWGIEEKGQAVVVDPGESEDVMTYLEETELDLIAILLTHNHDDHIGGVLDIYESYPDIAIFGPDETEPLVNHNVQEGDSFELLGQTFEVFKTAGHTEGHISYLTDDLLFCGDALFSGGCGRVFTDDYQAQYDALQKFKELDGETKVYAAHEYTEINLRFAQSIEPDNQVIADALEEAQNLLIEDKPTLPSTIQREKDINLFLQADTLEDFVELRKKRDDF